MGKYVAHFIRFAGCVLWRSQLLIVLGLLPLCYVKVSCLFDKVCYLYVFGKSVAYLIRLSAYVLLESWMLI